ncbi:hypothetical protein FGO68_gene17201 [Halteria grandinella]|uniref:Uncharacterized protein n=1 Tax=Halteria grandinella TaxID=5974 RepID=A0A8J8T0V5_HALGN|nr:hypothetical protein FGO68_gene17201 [Halteria grandinella]
MRNLALFIFQTLISLRFISWSQFLSRCVNLHLFAHSQKSLSNLSQHTSLAYFLHSRQNRISERACCIRIFQMVLNPITQISWLVARDAKTDKGRSFQVFKSIFDENLPQNQLIRIETNFRRRLDQLDFSQSVPLCKKTRASSQNSGYLRFSHFHNLGLFSLGSSSSRFLVRSIGVSFWKYQRCKFINIY